MVFWNFQDKVKYCPCCKKVYDIIKNKEIIRASINILKKTDADCTIELYGAKNAIKIIESEKELLSGLVILDHLLLVADISVSS